MADTSLLIIPTSLKDETTESLAFTLKQNYPNPFNPETIIRYAVKTQLIASQLVTLKIFDISGREIQTLVNEHQNAGKYSLNFDARNLPSGIYFYRLTTSSGFTQSRKMILIK